jgi:zinc/manganese transport system substrate-binding protein
MFNKISWPLSLVLFVYSISPVDAKLNVLTTTTDLRSMVTSAAGDLVEVDSIAKGSQDPHFIEAKPSFMLKASRADLVVAVGLDLEVGWLPSILRGARNPKISDPAIGYLELGSQISPLDVTTTKLSRADGDVHPLGNPHFSLDPIRAIQAVELIAGRLGQLDPTNAAKYKANAAVFRQKIETRVKEWTTRISQTGLTEVVTYHKTLTYFLSRFNLKNPAMLEPKPGIPPTSGHILGVIDLIRKHQIKLILVENYFDPAVTRKIIQELPTVKALTVPVAVDGDSQVKDLEGLYEFLVQSIEKGAK